MMVENHFGDENRGGWTDRSEERLGDELKRIWDSEIKGYFKAEGDFLRTYGLQAGYEDPYIRSILADHRMLEALVKEGGEKNIRLFSLRLAGHFRFKEQYAIRHIEKITGTWDSQAPPDEPS